MHNVFVNRQSSGTNTLNTVMNQCCTPPFFSNSAAFSKTMRRRSAAWEI
jgi:hypothetical protein